MKCTPLTNEIYIMKKTALALRTCNEDMTSHNGFQWPDVGHEVSAPDWQDSAECGYGLHGWLYGHGDAETSPSVGNPKAKWVVVEVEEDTIINLGGKVKFHRGIVRFVGSKADATAYLAEHEPRSSLSGIIGRCLMVGGNQMAFGGDYSTLTGGYGSTLTGDEYSTLTGGDGSTLTGDEYSTLTGGDGSTLTGGDGSTLTGGEYSTLTGGGGSTLTGGEYSTLTGGEYSTLTGGDGSTLTGGDGSTLTGGDGSELRIRYFDHESFRHRTAIAYVGEATPEGLMIEPNVAYGLGSDKKFIKA